MKRFPVRFFAAAIFIGCSAACTPYVNVGVTTSASLVTGCEKVGDVAVSPSTAPAEVNSALSDAARAKGANYVVVPEEGARTGAAYRCQMPSAGAH